MDGSRYRISALTHTGQVRDHNEDNFIINPDLTKGRWQFENQTDYSPSAFGSVWVVADGMGGANAGEIASEIAVQTVRQEFEKIESSDLEDIEHDKFLKKLMAKANQNILLHSGQNPETKGMGTTMVVAWMLDSILHVCWVGDSRAYIFRSGELIAVSKDHSLVQNLIDEGKITEEQAFYHPHNNVITQNLGQDPNKLKPGYKEIRLLTDDEVLLCTDGLNGMLQDKDIKHILGEYPDIGRASSKLLNAALQNGGHDNITLILVSITKISSSQTVHQPSVDKSSPKVNLNSKKGGILNRGIIRKGLIMIGILLFGGGIAFWGNHFFSSNSSSDAISDLKIAADSLFELGVYHGALEKYQSVESSLSSNEPEKEIVEERMNIIKKEKSRILEMHYKDLVDAGNQKLRQGFYSEAINYYMEAEGLATGDSLHQDNLQYASRLVKLPNEVRNLIADTVHVLINGEKVAFGKYEVTQAQWKGVTGKNPSTFAGCDNCPVESISIGEVGEFIDTLSRLLGKVVRLPTIHEWEKVAKGNESFTYSGSKAIDFIGWYLGNSNKKTNKVGKKAPNKFGIYDMIGNVSEYVKSNKKLEVEGEIVKGGSWSHPPEECKISSFETIPRQEKSNNVGLRLVFESN